MSKEMAAIGHDTHFSAISGYLEQQPKHGPREDTPLSMLKLTRERHSSSVKVPLRGVITRCDLPRVALRELVFPGNITCILILQDQATIDLQIPGTTNPCNTKASSTAKCPTQSSNHAMGFKTSYDPEGGKASLQKRWRWF